MKKGLTKLEKHNIKQKICFDYETGKYSVAELGRKYGYCRRTAQKIVDLKFGKGSQKRRVMLRMREAKVPTRAIAEYFGISNIGVNSMIAGYNKKIRHK